MEKTRVSKNRLRILYEDRWICVVVKPAGLLSCEYPKSREKTAREVLSRHLKKDVFVVHRLDRETSGVMLFALSAEAKKKIMDDWQKIVHERLYRALVENPRSVSKSLPNSGRIAEPLAYNAFHRAFVPRKEDAKKFKTVSALTDFQFILRGKTHSLVELSLETGRKNQIRAHLAFHSHPIAGDQAYRAKTDPFHRLCLHARSLVFEHPFTNQTLSFLCEESAAWEQFVLGKEK